MKVDAFSMDLSSSRTYARSLTIQTQETLSFSQALATRPWATAPESPGATDTEEAQAASETSSQALADGQTVSLTQRFITQLETLREIVAQILEECREKLAVQGNFQLTGLDRVLAGQSSPAGYPLMSLTGLSGFQRYEYTQTQTFSYEEEESVSVAAQGVVETADGREIDFSMDIFMERQFFQESSVMYTETGYTLVDPIVVRTGGELPMFQGGQFSFDLNMDGTEESLSRLGEGYAFLALDLNGDGLINDGSELFGPSSGDGFAELAQYDEDGNLWLDENDSMFDEFVLWSPGEDSQETTLTRLKDAGVGAIYLASVSSQFNLTTEDNTLQGQLDRTSLALTEEGGVLPVYEMDYTV